MRLKGRRSEWCQDNHLLLCLALSKSQELVTDFTYQEADRTSIHASERMLCWGSRSPSAAISSGQNIPSTNQKQIPYILTQWIQTLLYSLSYRGYTYALNRALERRVRAAQSITTTSQTTGSGACSEDVMNHQVAQWAIIHTHTYLNLLLHSSDYTVSLFIISPNLHLFFF